MIDAELSSSNTILPVENNFTKGAIDRSKTICLQDLG